MHLEQVEFSLYVPSSLTKSFLADGVMVKLGLIELTIASFYGRLIMHTRVASLQSVWQEAVNLFALVAWKVK